MLSEAKMNKEIIEIELNGQVLKVVKKDENLYDVYVGDDIPQPNLSAENVIGYLGHCLHNLNYKNDKLLNEKNFKI